MNNNKSDPRPMIKYDASNKQMKQFRKNLKAWESRQNTKKMKKEQNNYAAKRAANAAKKAANNARTRILNSLFTNTPARPAPSFGHSPATFPTEWQVTPLGQAPASESVPVFGHQNTYQPIEGENYILTPDFGELSDRDMENYIRVHPDWFRLTYPTSSLISILPIGIPLGRSRRNRRTATRKNRRASRKTRRINRK